MKSYSLDVNFNESLTNDIVSFEQLGPDFHSFAFFVFKGNFNTNIEWILENGLQDLKENENKKKTAL